MEWLWTVGRDSMYSTRAAARDSIRGRSTTTCDIFFTSGTCGRYAPFCLLILIQYCWGGSGDTWRDLRADFLYKVFYNRHNV